MRAVSRCASRALSSAFSARSRQASSASSVSSRDHVAVVGTDARGEVFLEKGQETLVPGFGVEQESNLVAVAVETGADGPGVGHCRRQLGDAATVGVDAEGDGMAAPESAHESLRDPSSCLPKN